MSDDFGGELVREYSVILGVCLTFNGYSAPSNRKSDTSK